ncbi:phosphatase PAP2 family protein [Deinococcus arenicola]|uniref:Phosphatase PAP2 family protein n=1 Tax=Deinococcus arenicola TaxID=2994950 RepID=A0ABU4DNJ4_9DEIO|nr:phosphatase PAP2 family protein [Deinococcus sp. ZS9-10]MDV6374006.1 phosphatase PAP2 family protein [Deinococcus sp. ZS9-10]
MFSHLLQEIVPFLKSHWRTLLLLLLGVLLPLVLVAELTEDVFRDGGFVWDGAILEWYRAHRTPTLTGVALALGVIGGVKVLPLIALAIALLLARAGARVHAWYLFFALSGAALLNLLAKLIFQRPRPDELGAVLVESGFSFPSGHAMANAAFGIALGLIFWRSRLGWPVAVLGVFWGVLLAASRNYLGVHYPTDVIAGFLSAAAWVYGLYLVMGRRWPALRDSPGGKRDTIAAERETAAPQIKQDKSPPVR